MESGNEISCRITRINISESGGTNDEAAVMAVERRDSVITTSREIQPEMGGYFERGEIISDFTE